MHVCASCPKMRTRHFFLNRAITAVAPVPRMSWLIFVEPPLYEALGTLCDLIIRLASLIGAGVVAVVYFLLLRRTSRPISVRLKGKDT